MHHALAIGLMGGMIMMPLVTPGCAEHAPPALPWVGADVGKVGMAGRHAEEKGVFTLHGAGGGVFIAGDAFYYVYVPLKGDGEITVRAVSMKNAVPNTTFGLIARETLEYDAKDVYLFLRPNRGFLAACQARTTEDIESVKTIIKDTGIRPPCWLRMKRQGDLFETFLSSDGKEWRAFGSVTNPMSEYLYIGMMVCSHRTNMLTEAVFDNVSVTGTVPPVEQFRAEVAKTLARLSEDRPRDPQLNTYDELAAKRRKERDGLSFPARKKLISANVHSMPPPSEFVKALNEYEQRPFDGVVLTLQGGQRPFQRKPWSENRFLEDYKALASLESRVLTDNFIIVHTSSTIDWFDDKQWESAVHNTKILAKAALIGRCAGLFVDPEGYGANAWSYFDAVRKDEKTFEEFRDQVKKRGEEWIRAIQAELPAPRLLFAFLLPANRLNYDLEWPIASIQQDIPRMRYGLLPAFVNGILQGASDKTILIDGDESAYYYRKKEDYETFARYVREVLPKAFIDEDLRAKCARHVQVGLSLYPNFYFGTHSRTLGRHMTPEERARWYEHNVYWALKTTDEYVWDWLEGLSGLWTLGPDWAKEDKIPALYIDAIASARKKLAANADLGFDSTVLFDGVRTREAEKRPKAKAVKLAEGQAPSIDGKLDDPAWQGVEPLSTFRPMLAWSQEVQMSTQAFVRYDDDALYLAFRCQEDRVASMNAKTAEDDDYFILSDDHVLIMVASPKHSHRIYRFVVNPKGKVHDAVARQNPDERGRDRDPLVVDVKGYNSGWKAAVQVLTDSWTVEARIPWRDLDIQPQRGTEVSMNLGRYRTQGLRGDRTFWAPVLEMQGDSLDRMEPDLFGTIVLE